MVTAVNDLPSPTTGEAASGGLSFVQLGAMLYARRWLMFFTLLVVVCLTGVLSLVVPKSYTASADLFVDYRTSDPINGKLFHPMMDESYMQTQLDIIKSDEVAQQAITTSNILTYPYYQKLLATKGEERVRSEMLVSMIKNLEVNLRKTSRVVELRYTARSPAEAADMLNAVLKAYIAMASRISSAPARSRQEQYSAQLEALRADMDRIQQEATRYQQEYNIVESDERYDNASKQLAELSTRLMDVQAQYSQVSARRHAWQTMLHSGRPPDDLPEIAAMKVIGDLKSKLSEAESRLADMSDEYGSSHPMVRAAQAQRAALRQRLERESRAALSALLTEEGRYAEMLATLKGQMHNLEQQMLEGKQHRDVLGSLQRQLESARRIYDSAAQKYDEILMASNIDSPSLEVLRWAAPPERHSKPRLSTNLIMSVAVGLVVGLCLAFLVELANRRVRCLEDMQREFSIPVLGKAL